MARILRGVLNTKAIYLILRFTRLTNVAMVPQLQLLKPCLDTLFLIWIEIFSCKLQIAKTYGTLKQQYLGYTGESTLLTHRP